MKKIFLIFGFLGFFALESLGVDVFCNDTYNSKLELIEHNVPIGTVIISPLENFRKNFSHNGAQVRYVAKDKGYYKFNLTADNIRGEHGILNWNQVSVRFYTGFAGKMTFKIDSIDACWGEADKCKELNNSERWYTKYPSDIAGEILYYRVLSSDYSASGLSTSDKNKNYGGICYDSHLTNTTKFPNNSINVLYDQSQTYSARTYVGGDVNILIELNPNFEAAIRDIAHRFSATIIIEPLQSSIDTISGNINLSNSFTQNGKLYTQIIGKPFDLQLYKALADELDFTDRKLQLTLVNDKGEAVKFTSGSGGNVININQNKFEALNTSSIKINNIVIKNESNITPALKFKIELLDKTNNVIDTGYSDSFSARPKGYVSNLDGNTKIGGTRDQNLNDIKAIDELNNKVLGYNTMLETLNEKNIIKWTQDEKCKDGENIIEPNKITNMRIKFDSGLGSSYNVCYDNEKAIELNADNINANKCYFSYPDIGPTTINIYDDTWTAIDHDGDCIEGESGNVANSDGKIGCNIELQSDYYKFMLDKIMLKSKELSDKFSNMTYYLKDDVYTKSKERLESMMAADLKLNLNATLADGTTPKLYTKNYYAKDVNLDVTDNLTEEVYYYGVEKTADERDKFAIKIKSAEDDDTTKEKNDGKFTISKDAFYLGEASVSLKLNLGRKYNEPKAYKNITPDIFTLSGKDEDNVELEKGVVASDSEANFYYGRVFAPNYDIYANSGEVSLYYGVYFSGDESEEDKEKIKNFITSNETKTLEECKIPQLKDYYINPAFSGESTNEYLGANLTISENNAAVKENGKEKLILTYNGVEFPKTINIKITPNDEAKKYLLFDKFVPNDEKPIDTSFNATFYSLDKGGWTGSGEHGKVMDIGGENSDNAPKGNRRIDW
ncbi:hypothetical protein CIG1485E_0700 [Campylobacter iguaniorum]|uniref:Uncharacterized protein n=1 Tax=Campylobacter iguaniorum TaxID=1244531 RepID=A0A076F969_9BACT|nr:hypothetical protein [Campylobacter iguaniorum]AII14546.1 hypothetical protein CIG1485E_0700 [Campylobacter iguaniorum]